mmetsp:Transcript_17985/g.32843  ORF Transcript_17985/g.32843 Transcript_17985/m.32843 type:complete len:272 (-) Transcript_17985:132-947(-)
MSRTLRDKSYWIKTPLSDIKKVTEGPPIDFSFKDLKSVVDIVHEEPVSGKPKRGPIPSEENAIEYLEKLYSECVPKGQQPIPSEVDINGGYSTKTSTNGFVSTGGANLDRSSSGNAPTDAASSTMASREASPAYVNSVCVRLSNNLLTSLNRLDLVMYHLLDVPSLLSWLDLSCNKLTSVDTVLVSLKNLQVLYLHGNEISSLSEVDKLRRLKGLKKLTLHGNPITEQKQYKFYVCTRVPTIQNLDFSAVTKLEQQAINSWIQAHTKKKDK